MDATMKYRLNNVNLYCYFMFENTLVLYCLLLIACFITVKMDFFTTSTLQGEPIGNYRYI